MKLDKLSKQAAQQALREMTENYTLTIYGEDGPLLAEIEFPRLRFSNAKNWVTANKRRLPINNVNLVSNGIVTTSQLVWKIKGARKRGEPERLAPPTIKR